MIMFAVGFVVGFGCARYTQRESNKVKDALNSIKDILAQEIEDAKQAAKSVAANEKEVANG